MYSYCLVCLRILRIEYRWTGLLGYSARESSVSVSVGLSFGLALGMKEGFGKVVSFLHAEVEGGGFR